MHLFLSPHLDDAVLSCGATIHQLTARGESVMILTTMAGDPPDPLPKTPIVDDLHQRWRAGYNPVATRRAEDEAACRRLGAQALHWMLGDCVYRMKPGTQTALYPSEDSLWGAVHPDDPAPGFLREAALPAADALYVPLGSRDHVDHRIVRDWGEWLGQQHPEWTILLYEEYPYESDATMELARALAHFETDRVELKIHLLDEANVEVKLQAIGCYQSQISTFWHSLADMETRTRESMRAAGNGTFAERFWRVQQAQT